MFNKSQEPPASGAAQQAENAAGPTPPTLPAVDSTPTVSLKVPEGVPDGPEAIHHNGRFYEVVRGVLMAPVEEVESLLKRGFTKVEQLLRKQEG